MSSYSQGITLDDDANEQGYYSGGSNKTENSSPFTKGFFYVFFTLPTTIFSDNVDANKASIVLGRLIKDYQPPGNRTINTVQDIGIGNTKSNFITGQETTQEFNLIAKEKLKSPSARIISRWTGYIDPLTGGSAMAKTFGPNEYKGSCIVIQTKPITRAKNDWLESDIIKIHSYDGVFPVEDPLAPFANNIETNTEKVEIPIRLMFDGQPITEYDNDLLQKSVALLRNQDSLYDEISDYYQKFSQKDFSLGVNAT